MPQPFEQLPDESAKAFAAFSLYLGLGPQRSCDAVAKKLGKSNALIERWSRCHGWIARVDAHARHFAGVEAEAQAALVRGNAAHWLKRQQDLREEEWAVHDECIRAAREALKRFYERGRGATLGDIARMLELASKLGRLASGMATDRTEVTGEDGGPVRVEFEAALKKVYGEVVDVEEVPVHLTPALSPGGGEGVGTAGEGTGSGATTPHPGPLLDRGGEGISAKGKP
jgi:hypothetical protein